MEENKMDGLKKAEEKVVEDTHVPAEKPQEASHATLDAEDKVVDPKPVEAKPEAPVAKPVVCPKCEKRNVLVNDEGAYCTACGSLGNAKEVARIIADKKDAEAKLNAEWHMPPLPVKWSLKDAEARIDQGSDFSMWLQSVMAKQDEMIAYITWLGSHFRREMNFICECGKEYSPKKGACPNCNPTKSLAIKR